MNKLYENIENLNKIENVGFIKSIKYLTTSLKSISYWADESWLDFNWLDFTDFGREKLYNDIGVFLPKYHMILFNNCSDNKMDELIKSYEKYKTLDKQRYNYNEYIIEIDSFNPVSIKKIHKAYFIWLNVYEGSKLIDNIFIIVFDSKIQEILRIGKELSLSFDYLNFTKNNKDKLFDLLFRKFKLLKYNFFIQYICIHDDCINYKDIPLNLNFICDYSNFKCYQQS